MMARATARDTRTGSQGLRSRFARFWHPREYLLAIGFLGALGVGGFWGTWQNLCAGDACPSIARISTFEHEQKSKILAADGEQIAEFGFETRTPIRITDLPVHVHQSVVAMEDKRFYQHGGFDPIGFTRAAIGVITLNYAGGGSTITQQLARNLFAEIGFEQRYTRKIKELQVALDLERSYTKEQILEAYLNEIYMGGVYGFQAASLRYFGKGVADVNVAEAALLTAILNRPTWYNPFTNPERALARRNTVLDLMEQQRYLTQSETELWKSFPLPEVEPDRASTQLAPYFEEWVRQILADRFGEEIYRGGFRVYTTLDIQMQEAARAAMEAGWAEIEADSANFLHQRYEPADTSYGSSTPYLQGAFISLDPETGHVKALIGGRDFQHSKFDRARQARRQAGSSFKPFVYTAALNTGIPASYIVEDIPVVYPQLDGSDWRPSNFVDEFKGPMTLREGLYTSTNMIAIRLGWEEVGIETVAQTARRMGIMTEIERFPSTTIGASEVIPLQIAEAYSSFPNMGTKVRPFPILRVEDDNGTVIWEPQPEKTTVLEPLPTRIVVDMLEDVVRRGTAYTAVRVRGGLPHNIPAAGKTGTTNDGTDVWFTGFTGNLLATVWFGMDTPQPIFRLGPGRRQATGGGLAAPVWGSFMSQVYRGTSIDDDTGRTGSRPLLARPQLWEIPDGLNAVVVDRKTGLLASRWCPEEDQYTEYYIPGTEPTDLCDRSSRRFRSSRIRGSQ